MPRVQCPHCHAYREAATPDRSQDGAWHFVCACGYRWAGFRDGAPIGYGGVNPARREDENETPCLHTWEQIACIHRAEIASFDTAAHTAFHLLGCTTCRTVDAFPVMNAELATPGYIARLRTQLAAGGWVLPESIAWRGAHARATAPRRPAESE